MGCRPMQGRRLRPGVIKRCCRQSRGRLVSLPRLCPGLRLCRNGTVRTSLWLRLRVRHLKAHWEPHYADRAGSDGHGAPRDTQTTRMKWSQINHDLTDYFGRFESFDGRRMAGERTGRGTEGVVLLLLLRCHARPSTASRPFPSRSSQGAPGTAHSASLIKRSSCASPGPAP